MSLAVKQFNVVKMILNKSIFDENIILTEYWQLLPKNKIPEIEEYTKEEYEIISFLVKK